MYSLSVRTRIHGPIFNAARTDRVIDDYVDDIEDEGAEWALDHIKGTYHVRFRQPTGFYESNVRIHTVSSGKEVWDGGLSGPVYGPWLEGIGSRNNTTRFKGYHAFRLAAQALERRITGIGERLMYTNVIRRLQ